MSALAFAAGVALYVGGFLVAYQYPGAGLLIMCVGASVAAHVALERVRGRRR